MTNTEASKGHFFLGGGVSKVNAPDTINKHPRPDPTNGLCNAQFTLVDVDLPISFPRDRSNFTKALIKLRT